MTNDSLNSTQLFLYTQNIHESTTIIKIIVALLIIILNGLFLFLLFKNMKRSSWKRYIFIANMAFVDTVLGIILLSAAVLSFIQTSVTVNLILQAVNIWTVGVSVLSYTGLMWVQYHALRRPLQYKTKLTTTKIKCVLCVIWIPMMIYGIIRFYLITEKPWTNLGTSIFDGTFLITSFLFNTFFYIYILRVSVNEKRYRSKSKLGPIEGNELRKNYSDNKNCEKSLSKQYHFVLTTGLCLILYWITALPFWLYWLRYQIHGGFTATSEFQTIMIVWNLRALFFPLVYLFREPKLFKLK